MRPTKKVWFSAESKRAGWTSALANLVIFCLLAGYFRNADSTLGGLLYPICAIALGFVAVGTLNWRRWHSFSESVAASFQAVLAIIQITLLVLMLGALVAFAWLGPAASLVVLLYVGAALMVIFAIALVLACGSGAALYGLLVVMRYAARIAQPRSVTDELKPRPLASVSL